MLTVKDVWFPPDDINLDWNVNVYISTEFGLNGSSDFVIYQDYFVEHHSIVIDIIVYHPSILNDMSIAIKATAQIQSLWAHVHLCSTTHSVHIQF